MKCPKCNFEIEDLIITFCGFILSGLRRFCPKCDQELPKED